MALKQTWPCHRVDSSAWQCAACCYDLTAAGFSTHSPTPRRPRQPSHPNLFLLLLFWFRTLTSLGLSWSTAKTFLQQAPSCLKNPRLRQATEADLGLLVALEAGIGLVKGSETSGPPGHEIRSRGAVSC